MLALLGLLQLVLLHICSGVAESGVRVTSLDVPNHVARGDNVNLTCLWDLNSYNLYSVKWYRDDREFYRFIPSENEKGILNLPGINVDEERSDGHVVVLLNVGLDTGGHYKCEVISQYPEFHTADKSKEMLVVEVPQEKPTINGTRHEYRIGDTARLTCVSAKSRPPAELTWYINNDKAPKEYLTSMPSVKHHSGLEQTRLSLEFEVTRKHFVKGEMTLRCTAKISSLYYKTQQHSFDGQLTYYVPVMESRDISAVSGGAGPTQHPLTLALLALVMTVSLAQTAMMDSLDGLLR
ncbi:uncharacterized protein LOC122245036 [Penaeus japonicus]|uniref:uncharacterized protein LOC122245036 n=2 Tax=Penaeus japonicus TaxID=27405 RepID=UPI001C70BE9C|nr:uncharacterized protein LOC122245036 [Penaeus japonicus]XP_042858919.1 uncharacterized protein LOC122245036 [Penaeus japonicus]